MFSLVPTQRTRTGLSTPFATFPFDLDRLFEGSLPATRKAAGVDVRLEVVERDAEILIRAELPGIAPEDVDIQLTGDTLVLSGTKQAATEEQTGGKTYTERTFGAFRRTVELPCAVDLDSVEAVSQNGLLEITLKKSQAVLPKRIEIKRK